MRTYRVEVDASAWADIDELTDWIRDNMSRAGGDRYIDAMICEIYTLSVFADLYQESRFSGGL